jgi:SAM-dependent methyltransferase
VTATGDIYLSRRLAYGYAFQRPPVHPRVLALVAQDLGITRPVGRALDIGCGAGLSTAALAALARVTVGLDPAADMLAHRRQVAPHGQFVVASAEAPPFTAGAFDLVTAAGSLNYVDLPRFLPEASRLLAADGTLVVYDFSSGRRLADDPALERWFASLEDRYPFPPGYRFDLAGLNDDRAGLRIDRRRDFVISLPLTAATYLEYVLTEANVEQAIAAGARAEEIGEWCRAGLVPIFGARARNVQFEGYVVYVRKIS